MTEGRYEEQFSGNEKGDKRNYTTGVSMSRIWSLQILGYSEGLPIDEKI